MRRVVISDVVRGKLADLEVYLQQVLHFSKSASRRRSDRMRARVLSLGNPGDHALCRFRRWRQEGWRCLSFEGWVFAYQVFPDGVIVRDMAHGSMLTDVVS